MAPDVYQPYNVILEQNELVSYDPRFYYNIPDVRDGLTELERTILYVLWEARKEYGDRHIPTTLIWGRVVELLDVSREHFLESLKSVTQKEKDRRYK